LASRRDSLNPIRKPALLVLDDDPDAVDAVRDILERSGYEVLGFSSVNEARSHLESEFVDLLLLDERMGRHSGTQFLSQCRSNYPGLGGILISGYVDKERAIAALRAGAIDVLEKPVDKEQLLSTVSTALSSSELIREARFERWRAARSPGEPDIIGQSDALQKLLGYLPQLAATTAPVLIQGESGTGKELIARAIHARSPRRLRPFIAVNAGGLAPTLLESTLFGSKKGSYTDSRSDQAGYFEAASGGTLFLDEIGETLPELQVRLLRVLQEKTVTRVGDTQPRPVDARIVAATNRDLRREVEAGRFRQDLYYRLAVFPLTLPPLRERKSDIPALARHLLAKHIRELGRSIRGFSETAVDKLAAYPWPGNIRELDNVIQRAAILADGLEIGPESLWLDNPADSAGVETWLEQPFREAELGFERRYFLRLMDRARDNKTKAAELAEIDRKTLYDHLRKTRISNE
jgi:DNA-binding NtrC family response regulator